MSKKLPQADLVGQILDEFREALLTDETFTSGEIDNIDHQLRKKYPPSNKKLNEILTPQKNLKS